MSESQLMAIMMLNDFFNLILVYKDIEPRYVRTRTRGFLLIVRVVSLITCMLSINLLKYLFVKFSG